jgi:hypothetical protein
VLGAIEEETRKEKERKIWNPGTDTAISSSSTKALVLTEKKSAELSQ